MIKYAVAVVAAVSICSAIPAGAEEVGIGVGPHGVTVGEGHGDRDRDVRLQLITSISPACSILLTVPIR